MSNFKMVVFPKTSALVVDDEGMSRMITERLLREHGMHVDTAESGREAIRKAGKKDYDLVVMENSLKGMDGTETMKYLRSILSGKPKVPAMVAYTAGEGQNVREHYLTEGFDDYLEKPAKSRDLERMLERNVVM